jgi:hypothetical protein
MYDTGNAGFLAAACSPNRTIDTYAKINTPGQVVEVNTNDVVSYKATYASTGGKSFTPGSFVAGQMDITLNASSNSVRGVDFKQVTIQNVELFAGIAVGSTMVNIPLGVFYPNKDGVKVTDDGHVELSLSDIPPSLSEQFDFDELTYPITLGNALLNVASKFGLSLDITLSDFSNSSVELEKTFTLVTTGREAIMYLVELLGGYATMGRFGQICVRRCFSGLVDIGCALDENHTFSVNRQESSVKPYQYIGIKANKDDLGVTAEVSGINTNCQYDIIDNPLTYGHPEDFLAGLVVSTAFSEFYPAKVSFQGRPDIDTGDVLEYTHKGVTYLLPVCKHVFEYNGGFKTTIESVGTDALKTSSVDSGLKSQVSALKQNINNLVRDLSQTQSQIIEINGELVNISEVLQTVDVLKTQVSKIEGDVGKLSTLTQTADQLRIDIKTVADSLVTTNNTVANNQNTLLSYFDFQADALTIGVSNSNIRLKLSNNKIYFLRDEQEVAYFSEGQLYVTDAHFIRSLVLGNFEFSPRSNGNLSLRRRG